MDGEVTRRELLRVTLLAGGGFAVGILLPGCHGYDAKTAEKAEKTGEFAPNAWVRVHPDDRVVFVLDRVEMGQGVMTSQTTLVAEELEIDPRKITVELAPSDRAYAQPDIGFQITGGSSSTKGGWVPLRTAGAVAREMLRAGAATTWGVALAECHCEDGAVVHGPSGRRGTYGQFTRAAAHAPVPTPRLKTPDQFKWIGKSIERLDGRSKVDGSAVYGLDVKVPGLLTAVVLRCPVFGGKLASFDAARAKASPGVVDVFAVPSGVAVVATSFWKAKKASELVDVKWHEGALATLDSAGLRAHYADLARRPAKAVRDDGSFARVAAGKATIDVVYEAPYLAHATMEPQNCTAHVTADRCEIWAPTQAPGMATEQARRILGLDESAITVHQTLLGGGFGRRLGDDFVAEAIHVSRQLQRPVKVVWTREDDTRHDFYRPATYNVLRAVVEGGEVTGWFHHIVGQSIVSQVVETWAPLLVGGAPQSLKPFVARTAAHLYQSGVVPDESATESAADFAYALPNLRVEYTSVDPGVPVGFWRSVGHSENAFIVESFLDELAHAAKRDPVDLRLGLLKKAPRHRAVLERAAKEAGWGTPPPAGRSRGVAMCKSFGTFCAQVVEVSVDDRGAGAGSRIRVHRVVAAIDCGVVVNPDLVKAQVESAIVFGLSAALFQKVTLTRGRVDQSNFHDYKVVRMNESPRIEVHIVKSDEKPTGVGEPGLPPLAPAVANAVFAATGKRLRALPLTFG